MEEWEVAGTDTFRPPCKQVRPSWCASRRGVGGVVEIKIVQLRSGYKGIGTPEKTVTVVPVKQWITTSEARMGPSDFKKIDIFT